jgi:hypothetical protein
MDYAISSTDLRVFARTAELDLSATLSTLEHSISFPEREWQLLQARHQLLLKVLPKIRILAGDIEQLEIYQKRCALLADLRAEAMRKANAAAIENVRRLLGSD